MADNADLRASLQEVVTKYGDDVARLTGLDQANVTFVFDLKEGVANTQGSVIHINPAWFYSHPDDVGAIVHELVHAYQDIGDEYGTTIPKALVEDVADAVRYKLGLTYEGWEPNDRVKRMSELRPNQFRNLTTSMANGTWEEALKIGGQGGGGGGTTTGGNTELDQLQSHYQASATNRSAGGTGGGGGGGAGDGILSPEEILQQVLDSLTTDTQKTNFRSFLAIAQGFGISRTDPQMLQLAKEASKKGYDQNTYMFFLRQTAEYQAEFPGIFAKDGSMKMTEEQYTSNKEQYESIAAQAGLNYGPQQEAWLFQNNVSPAEYSVKAPSVARMRRDPQLFEAYKRELVQSGTAKPGEVTRDGMLRAVLGMGNAAWKDVWQDAITRNAAVDAGIRLKAGAKGYLGLGQGVVEKVSGKNLSEESMAQGFATVAEQLLTSLPLSKIQGYGLSKQDLVNVAFGGKGSAKTRQLIQHMADQEKAFSEDRATPGVQSIPTGGAQVAAPRPQTA